MTDPNKVKRRKKKNATQYIFPEMGPIYTHTKKLEITWNKAALPNNAK
jgi:hypothetical protein